VLCIRCVSVACVVCYVMSECNNNNRNAVDYSKMRILQQSVIIIIARVGTCISLVFFS
jgi:hypothetical protein